VGTGPTGEAAGGNRAFRMAGREGGGWAGCFGSCCRGSTGTGMTMVLRAVAPLRRLPELRAPYAEHSAERFLLYAVPLF